MYNITNITNANTVHEIVKATNDLSGGLLMGLFLLVIFITFLIVFKRRDFKKTMLAASFFIIIIGGLAWAAGWVSWSFLIVPVILFGGILLMYYFME